MKYIRQHLNLLSLIPSLMNDSNQFIADSSVKANMFNRYFSSVFTVDDGEIPTYSSTICDQMPDFKIDEYDVLEAINFWNQLCQVAPTFRIICLLN